MIFHSIFKGGSDLTVEFVITAVTKNSPNIGIAIPNNLGIAKHIKSTFLYV